MRDIPIFTFINKMDREARRPLRPAGRDRTGAGHPHLSRSTGRSAAARNSKGSTTATSGRSSPLPATAPPTGPGGRRSSELDVGRPRLDEMLGESAARHSWRTTSSCLTAPPTNSTMDKVRHGKLSPVFFGSALTNFGVEPFLRGFPQDDHAAPAARTQPTGMIDPFDAGFFRLCLQDPGEHEQGPPRPHRVHAHLLRQVREGHGGHATSRAARRCKLSQPQQLMAQDREIIDEAYAGDIIGVFDPGIFSIGDTLCAPRQKFAVRGHPDLRAGAFRPRPPDWTP